ncbi:DUF975 family protein [uncultured Holdemanella sp.]|uniref:DUF975 family protein n=1 Tax=uncultured Holdemanella sp. TaxID=1763549 RepID=UPI00265B0883|nr:DUF975 family protein [uncultured Holdemanella sp.]
MKLKEIKKNAHKNVKAHYATYLVLCLAAVLMGSEFSSTLSLLKQDNAKSVSGLLMHSSFVKSMTFLLPEDVFGTTNGVFAHVVNGITSGSFVKTLFLGLSTIVHSKDIASICFVVIGLCISVFYRIYIVNVLPVVNRRLFLEGRVYAKLPLDRLVYLMRIRKQMHVAFVKLVKSIILTVMNFTVVGGIYFYYTYYLVDYILAENPTISLKDALSLSRNMMKGHKFECFKWQLSMAGWYILDICTFGISAIFYSNMYRMSVMCEFYTLRRKEFQSAILNDTYLFEKPSRALMRNTYSDVIAALNAKNPMENAYTGIKKFLCDNFGIIFHLSTKEKQYERYTYNKMEAETMITEVYLLCYPVRLSPIEEEYKKSNLRVLHPNRNYTITSILMCFFFMCFVGWIWEVSLSMISYGRFVNRGVLHGPWIPIYGFGCVLILLLLKRFRMRPKVEFSMAVLLCGCIEYFTGLVLELTHNGQKWWDYTGYFLNLHGRICAEGLLVFGVGGMAFVYVIAPLIDNWVKEHLNKRLSAACLVLLLLFGADVVYSHFEPNVGEGVTG